MSNTADKGTQDKFVFGSERTLFRKSFIPPVGSTPLQAGGTTLFFRFPSLTGRTFLSSRFPPLTGEPTGGGELPPENAGEPIENEPNPCTLISRHPDPERSEGEGSQTPNIPLFPYRKGIFRTAPITP